MNRLGPIKIVHRIAVLMISLLTAQSLAGQQIAFPGAEGFGAYSKGGRGGDVYIVSNLNDSGKGSLRYGIKSANGPRTVVFAVSGLIELEKSLKIDKDYMTIAGQSAPGDGICLKDASLRIEADHVIVRYIRSRLGHEKGKQEDAISIFGGHNIIVDHCSVSWSVDEGLSVSTRYKDQIDSVSVQWNIISEALNKSIHDKKEHGYGALIRGCYGAKYSFHHNLFAHNNSRNPRPGNYDTNNYKVDPQGLLLDFRNNVIYNWKGSRPGYDGDAESVCRYNYVANYLKPGPDSDKDGHAYDTSSKYFQAFYEQNMYGGEIPEDQWELVRFKNFTTAEIVSYKSNTPFPSGGINTDTPEEAFDKVLEHAGASHQRDKTDIRVIQEVKNGTGSIIDDEKEVGGWPIYRTEEAKLDADQDGIPDQWELKNGLDPHNAEDRNKYKEGYTFLEIYLNGLLKKQ